MKILYSIAGICLVFMALNTYYLEEELNEALAELEASKIEIKQLKLVNEYQSRFIVFTKEMQEENDKRKKEIEDVLANNKNWSDSPLPDDIQRMFDNALRSQQDGNTSKRVAN